MKITNDTTTYQLAELMGSEADERDGRILMSLLLTKHGITDTDEISESLWSSLLDEVCEIRREQEVYDAEVEENEDMEV